MARFCPLFSSSSGNCTYIGNSSGGILIDVGVSARRTKEALLNIDVDPCTIKAVFITHEHSDHINGLRVLTKNNNIDVFASAGTLRALSAKGIISNVSAFEMPSQGIEAAGMFVKPFPTSHDANESCGYTITTSDDRRISVATDTGILTDEIMNAIYGSDLIMIESNHDVAMLQNGPYQYWLKRRILSDLGHLSNDSCATAVRTLVNGGTTRVFLAHLSKENNYPPLAYQTTYAALCEIGAQEGKDYILKVAGTPDSEKLTVF
jgi:phosphoribosyl 1,2-cyclic phosphodiesterase